MIVGVCLVDLHLLAKPGCLKAKRKIINQMKEKLKSRLGVLVSEVGAQELWHRATLGIVTLGSDYTATQKNLQNAFLSLSQNYEVEILRHFFEYENYKF